MLEHSNVSTGLSVSPYTYQINERVQVNLEPLPEAIFAASLGQFLEIVAKASIKLTYFELLIAFAFWYFHSVPVNYAVMETGLGGLLDATNVATQQSKICVITDIGFDHTAILGETLPEIAFQKAGIIHPGNKAVMLQQPANVEAVFKARCREVNAELNIISNHEQQQLALEMGPHYKTLPPFQQRNALLAYAACKMVAEAKEQLSLTVHRALSVPIPGRMETIKLKSGQVLILDGAHNPQKMSALKESLYALYPNSHYALLFAMKAAKDYQASVAAISGRAKHAFCVAFDAAQPMAYKSVDPKDLQQAFIHNDVAAEASESLEAAVDGLLARQEKLLVVTGSIYLLGQVRSILEAKVA